MKLRYFFIFTLLIFSESLSRCHVALVTREWLISRFTIISGTLTEHTADKKVLVWLVFM